MREKKAVGGLMVLTVLIAVIVAGCGGSRHLAAPSADARFAGQTTCEGCHSGIAADYALTHHGEDFTQHAYGDLVYGRGGACAPCHSVGYGEDSGFQLDGSTPYLENIGCEECHGCGSDHAASPSSANLMGVPDAETTCWNCHGPSYKPMSDPAALVVTDAKFYDKDPDSISVHHPQTTYLNGEYGYNHAGGSDDNPHLLVDNTCVSCHANPETSAVTLGLRAASSFDHGPDGLHPDATTCAPCHGGELGAQQVFEAFEEEVKDELIVIAGEDPSEAGEPDPDYGGGMIAAFIAFHGIDITSNNNPDDPDVKALKGVIHNYEYILHDASWGAHNPPFTEALLDEMKALLTIP
ncbi:MAG: multiheme c-type cytochrome [Armatimonadota bacterium]